MRSPDPRVNTEITVVSAKGVHFLVRYVEVGETFGRRDCLVTEQALVEFYDARFIDPDFGERGQFVSRYAADTLLGRDRYSDRLTAGLDLQGDVPAWKIDAAGMAYVMAWLDQVVLDSELALGMHT